MTKMKKLVSIGAVVLMVSAFSTTAMAASNYKTPAEAAAGVTGKTVEEVTQIKQDTDKTYGTIAKDAGKLEEFKTEMFDMKKDFLATKVADGTITQEKADEIINEIKENQANCDGTGSKGIMRKYGLGFGKSNGQGKGNGQGMRMGNGQRGSCNGACSAQ
ncbi:hypothetical protein RBG61_03440 [Paludicola sp. MB14-C6]|uniref:hypothetical protein n=1 Tax=Paludihabitans sp. MB14-C6 TaxID=3070656 RepID=UPI0027DC5330|nr:hypothetical protein [Paludicola sp. MB14-C6]WMJ23728.1 hypothetical protein RBG61_03440 [Paludicola sp. MB14-C6]